MHPTPEENKLSQGDESVTGDAGGAPSGPQSETEPDLADSVMQEKYRREYLRQIRQRSCPGCGDDEIL
jgi:hypothetical protein